MEFIYDEPPKTNMPSDIMHPTSRILFRFWEATRGELSAAKKQDLDLKRIAKILPSICILEREALIPVYKWRLAGTAICKLWGMEVTGIDVLHNWPEFEKQTMVSGFDMVIATMQPCVARFKAISELGDEIGVEMLALPIQDANTGMIQILASVVPFQAPEWLGVQQLMSFELSTIRKIWTDALPDDEIARTVATRYKDGKKAPPFLKVITGGKI
jgi:hypothetical protein